MARPPQEPPINDRPCPTCGWPIRGIFRRRCSNPQCQDERFGEMAYLTRRAPVPVKKPAQPKDKP